MSPTPTIRSASLSGYVELAEQLGLEPGAMLRAAGLSRRMLQDPESPIRLDAARRLLEDSARAAGVEDFGLRLAQGRRLSNLGPIAIVLREEPTARAALDTLVRYLRLLNATLITRIEDAADLVLIREELLADTGAPVRQSIELALGVMVRTLSELLGPQWRPRRVLFAHRAPGRLHSHHALFGPALEFNAPFNGIVCAARDLAAPLPRTDTGLAPFARRFLDQALARDRGSTQDHVRQLVGALLPVGRCTADQVAQHLGVDRRTLHRHLAREGLTFTALLQSVRAEFAARQVRDSDHSLTELAGLLGFASASALAYWFRGRFGCTVGQWRARQLAPRSMAASGARTRGAAPRSPRPVRAPGP